MNSKSVLPNYKTIVSNILSWLFGIIFFAMGVVNTFWGNDPLLGIGLLVLSFVYFPPATELLREKTGFTIPGIAKIILAMFLLWVTLGVGELFYKIDLMIEDL